jgi:putative FmdB family regulatory protein
MPVYDYLCARCGPFTDMRPMAESALPHECPECGKDAPRAFLTAPYFAAMSADRRLAHATNERSASSPQVLSTSNGSHGGGCRCCSGKSLRYEKSARGGASPTSAKGFPARRPWMISH